MEPYLGIIHEERERLRAILQGDNDLPPYHRRLAEQITRYATQQDVLADFERFVPNVARAKRAFDDMIGRASDRGGILAWDLNAASAALDAISDALHRISTMPATPSYQDDVLEGDGSTESVDSPPVPTTSPGQAHAGSQPATSALDLSIEAEQLIDFFDELHAAVADLRESVSLDASTTLVATYLEQSDLFNVTPRAFHRIRDRIDRVLPLVGQSADEFYSRTMLVPPAELLRTSEYFERLQTQAQLFLEYAPDELLTIIGWARAQVRRQRMASGGPTETATREAPMDGSKKPVVFISHGHSPYWRELKDYIKDRLHLDALYFEQVSHVGEHMAEILTGFLDAADCAIVLLTPDDEQADSKERARQNVVHEAGFFQGKLGFKRVAIVVQSGVEEFSNVAGIIPIRFEGRYVRQAFPEIEDWLVREDLLPSR